VHKSEEDCREELLQYLECHDPNKYRKKIKGFHIAFNIRDKDLRVKSDELSKYKFQSKLPPEEIKRLATEAKLRRAQEKIAKEKEEKEKYQKEREALRKMHEQMRREKGLAAGTKKVDPAGYQDIGAKQGNEKHLKITFAVIEKMHYSDFNSGNDAEDFKPSDIIDEEDATLSDDEVLRKFKHVGLLGDFDSEKMGPKQGSKELLESGPLGLKQNKGSPRVPDTTIATKNVETLRRAGVAKGAPYLIDPL